MTTITSKQDAEAALQAVFDSLGNSLASVPLTVRKPTAGKVYELVVLADVLQDLRQRGFFLSFSNPGGKLALKAGPGQLDQSDPHFDVATSPGGIPAFEVFVSVEFRTMGSAKSNSADLSQKHEIDIGVFDAGCAGYPSYEQVALAVECKAVASLTKSIVRGILGMRRELSVLTESRPSKLAQALGQHRPLVPAHPRSEVWLVASDPRVSQYRDSPEYFGVLCRHVSA